MKKFILHKFITINLILFLTNGILANNPKTFNDEVNLQLKWKHQFQFAGYYAAVEKGFYKRAGLKVNIIPDKPNLDVIEQVVSGKAEYGVSFPDLLVKHSKGYPVVVLAAIFQHSPYILFTDKTKSITSPQNLVGETIMLRKESSAEIIAMLINEGVYNKINIINHTWNFEDIINKEVSGAAAYITDKSYIKEKIEDYFSIIKPITYGIDFYGDCLFTSEEEIKNNPERVAAFLDASLQGWKYAFENPEEIIDLIITKYDKSASKINLLYEAEKMRELILPELVQIGHMNEGRWQHILATYKKLNMIDADYQMNGFLYQDYKNLNNVWPSIILISLAVTLLVLIVTLILNSVLRKKILGKNEKLAASEMKYKTLFDKSSESIFIIHPRTGTIINANQSAIALCRRSIEELKELNIFEISSLNSSAINKINQTTKKDNKIKIFDSNGNNRTVLFNVIHSDNDILIGSAQDITEKIISEKELKIVESKANALLEAIPDMMFRLDRSGIFLDYQADKSDLYASAVDTIIGRNFRDLLPKDICEMFESKIEAVFETGKVQTFDYDLTMKNSRTKDYEARLVKSSKNEIIAIVRDITEKKEAEKKIKEQQAKFKTFFSSVNDSIFVHPHLEEGFGNFIEVNEVACKRYGYSREEFLRLTAADITVQSDALIHATKENRKKLLTKGNLIFETLHRSKDGEVFPVEISSNIIEQFSEPIILAIVRDISDRKRIEYSLKQSEEKYRSMFHENQSVLLLIDPDTQNIVDANKAAVDFYGYPYEVITNMKVSQINTMSKDEVEYELEQCALKNKNHFNFKHRLANGEIRYVEVYSGPVNEGNKVLLYSIIHDITKQLEAEKALIEGQRLSAMGVMSSAVAHDFNNLLQAILGNIELVLLSQGISETSRKYLETIKLAAGDASERVKLLQRFGGKREIKSEYKSVSINKIIKETIKQSRPLWKDDTEKKGISIAVSHNDVKVSNVLGNEAELRTVLFNLIKNSIEAMPYGGTIKFETYENDDIVGCAVIDTGIGIADDDKAKIIEPFYTTKGFDNGRGLGLSGAYSIIKEHNGDLFVKDTDSGKGCNIVIELPKMSENFVAVEVKNEEINEALNILWVEDEEILRESGLEFLKILGHNGQTASNGNEALKLLKENNYDIVITDIGMPEMSGWQLAENINNNFYGEVKLIIMTGWGAEIDNEELNKHNISGLLNKPFKLNDLRKIIAEVSQLKHI